MFSFKTLTFAFVTCLSLLSVTTTTSAFSLASLGFKRSSPESISSTAQQRVRERDDSEPVGLVARGMDRAGSMKMTTRRVKRNGKTNARRSFNMYNRAIPIELDEHDFVLEKRQAPPNATVSPSVRLRARAEEPAATAAV